MQVFDDLCESTEKRETMTPRGVRKNKIFSDEENNERAVTEEDYKTRSIDRDH